MKEARLSWPQPGNALKSAAVMVRLGALGVVAQEASNRVNSKMDNVLVIFTIMISAVLVLPCIYEAIYYSTHRRITAYHAHPAAPTRA